MYRVTLRKLGGSVILTLPVAWLRQVGLSAGSDVGLHIDENKLIVEPASKPVYSLSDLVDEYLAERNSNSDTDWLDDDATGDEAL